MKGETGNTLTPRLRFPEFRDTESWPMVELGKIADIKLGKMLDREKHTSGRLLPYLNNVALRWNEVDTSNLPQMYFDDDELDRFALKAGDVVVCEGGEPGRCAVWDGQLRDLKFQKAIHRVRFNVQFEPKLLVLYLEAIAGTQAFEMLFTGAGIRHLTRETFARLKVPHIAPAEQRKIAACLGSLDDWIGAEGRKLEALRSHKKGLMQQLFPRPGESRPRLRFPEFSDAGEWEEKALSDIATIRSGSTPLRANPEFFDGGKIPWVKTTDLNNSLIRSTEECITEKAKVTINPVGSILIAMYGGFKQIGRTGLLTFPAATNQALSVLRLDDKQVLPIYALAWLNAKVEDWKRIASSSRKDPNITGSDVARFPMQYPKLAEQQRIAACLSSLDDLLAAQARKVEGLKMHKKGLMQQLFPSAEGRA